VNDARLKSANRIDAIQHPRSSAHERLMPSDPERRALRSSRLHQHSSVTQWPTLPMILPATGSRKSASLSVTLGVSVVSSSRRSCKPAIPCTGLSKRLPLKSRAPRVEGTPQEGSHCHGTRRTTLYRLQAARENPSPPSRPCGICAQQPQCIVQEVAASCVALLALRAVHRATRTGDSRVTPASF